MARKHSISTTKYEIIQVASEFFLNEGVSMTSPKMIANKLNISTGNITYYFKNKEHLLAVFVEMLCKFQWKLMEEEANEGYSSIMALCLELAAMASMCEEDAIAKDFYLNTYMSDLCLEIIQGNDIKRAKQVFGQFCPDWTDERFAEAVMIVSGVEYATLKSNKYTPSLEIRIAGALDTILATYRVPEEMRKTKILKVLEMDYQALGRRVLKEFKEYVQKTNDETFEELFAQLKRT